MTHRDKRRRRYRGFLAENALCRIRRARCVDRILAQIPAGAKAVRLDERRSTFAVHYIVTRCSYPPGDRLLGEWRATRFDSLGPSSHFHGPDIATIIMSLNGYNLPGLGLPHASAGQFAFTTAR